MTLLQLSVMTAVLSVWQATHCDQRGHVLDGRGKCPKCRRIATGKHYRDRDPGRKARALAASLRGKA